MASVIFWGGVQLGLVGSQTTFGGEHPPYQQTGVDFFKTKMSAFGWEHPPMNKLGLIHVGSTFATATIFLFASWRRGACHWMGLRGEPVVEIAGAHPSCATHKGIRKKPEGVFGDWEPRKIPSTKS